jgi:CHAT domain-containing protein/Tfp pilus assembly protein PilF
MSRSLRMVASFLAVLPLLGAEPLSSTEREKLHAEASSLNEEAGKLFRAGKSAEAVQLARKALALREQLYSAAEYPDGHIDLSQSLTNLALLLSETGQYAQALPFFERSLAMAERLYPRDRYPNGHADLARTLNNLGAHLQRMGQYEKALEHFDRLQAMTERLYPPDRYPNGHPALAHSLTNLGIIHQEMGDYARALPYFEKALALKERFYPPEQFPDGHPDLASSFNSMGYLLHSLGEHSRARPYYEKAQAACERLYPPGHFPDGHPNLALTVNNLGVLFQARGEYEQARASYEKALGMRERLYSRERFPDGHPALAQSLGNLGHLFRITGEVGKALPYFEKALAMNQRLFPAERFPAGHPTLAESLHNLGAVLLDLGEHSKALPYFEKDLLMNRRLYPSEKYREGHPALATSLQDMGFALIHLGKWARTRGYFEEALAMMVRLHPSDRFPNGHPALAGSLDMVGLLQATQEEHSSAEEHLEKARAMWERLYPPERFPDGHPSLSRTLSNLGMLLIRSGKDARALPYLERALNQTTRQALRETAGTPEAQALALLGSLPRSRDVYLSLAGRLSDQPAASVYGRVWPTKGLLLGLASRRHQSVRVATLGSPETSKKWEQLRDIRLQLNRLAVEPAKNAAARDRQLVTLSEQQERRERDLAKQVPELDRHRQLAALGPKHLHDQLAPGTAFLDLVRYAHSEQGKQTVPGYLAFVLAPGRPIRLVLLGPAEPIDEAITSWRRSIDRREDSLVPRKLREQVWDRLSPALPPGTRVVYLCPDGDMARMPWAALPGSKPGSVLLEEVAVAVVPSGKWLLEQLLFPPREPTGPDTLVAAGAIDYGQPPPGRKAEYLPLPETGRELRRVLDAFGSTEELRGPAATPARLIQRLPQARWAHLATHGYFDQAGLRAERKSIQEQLAKWQPGVERSTERVGVRQHPLGYVGLALAGANDPGSSGPGGGILTGLGIVDLPLEDLRLCVLSACETGLGELTEGEGVIGLQRAFHVAGCANVIGSLWRVDDAATAALMTVFYHELRINKRSPLEALREAQLTIYRHPERIPALAGERGRPALEAAAKLGSAATTRLDENPRTTPTKLWAAFVLSGVGR